MDDTEMQPATSRSGRRRAGQAARSMSRDSSQSSSSSSSSLAGDADAKGKAAMRLEPDLMPPHETAAMYMGDEADFLPDETRATLEEREMEPGAEDSVASVDVTNFDWEQYIAAYTGRTRIERLLFIAAHSPALRVPCSTAALDLITSSSKDTIFYQRAMALRDGTEVMPAKSDWAEETGRANRTELERLDLELRSYQNNMIKESVRMGHRDLANHLRDMGNVDQAQKMYMKTRDYCSTSEHVVEMCLNVIDASLELRHYSLVQGYVSKAEALLDSYDPAAAAESAAKSARSGQPAQKGGSTSGADAIGALFRAGGSSTSDNMSLSNASAMLDARRGGPASRREADETSKRQVNAIRARLHVANSLAFLGLGRYEEAALSFLSVDASHGEAYSMLASQSDVALYLVICSVATFERQLLKSKVMGKADLSNVLEADAQAKQLLSAFDACEYKKALGIVEDLRTRLLLDLQFRQHYLPLTRRITHRVLRQFVEPFDTLKIDRLAASIGWEGAEGEARALDEILHLIQSRQIRARIDLPRRTLIADKADQRQALFDHALKTGLQQTASAKHLLLRVDLLQNGLIVKLPQEAAEA